MFQEKLTWTEKWGNRTLKHTNKSTTKWYLKPPQPKGKQSYTIIKPNLKLFLFPKDTKIFKSLPKLLHKMGSQPNHLRIAYQILNATSRVTNQWSSDSKPPYKWHSLPHLELQRNAINLQSLSIPVSLQ